MATYIRVSMSNSGKNVLVNPPEMTHTEEF